MSSTSQESWVSGSLSDAADMLAKRATVTRRLAVMKKESIDLSGLSTSVSMHPAMQKALIGAGIGAGIGGLTSLVQPKEKRKTTSSVLTGALAGGGLGVGAHYLGSALPFGSGSGSKTFHHDGKTYELDPESLAKNPAAMRELNELMAGKPTETAVRAVQGVTGGYAKNHPILSSILGADIASQVVGTVGSKTPLGKLRLADRPDILERGWGKIKAMNPEGVLGTVGKEDFEKMHKLMAGVANNPAKASQMLHDAQHVLGTNIPSMRGMTPDDARLVKEIMDKGHGTFRRGGISSIYDLIHSFTKKGPLTAQERAVLMQKGTGVYDALAGIVPDRGVLADFPGVGKNQRGAFNLKATKQFGPGAIWESLKNRQFGTAGAQAATGVTRGIERMPNPFGTANRFGRLGPRLGLYAGLPIMASYMGTARAPREREERVLELIKELSR